MDNKKHNYHFEYVDENEFRKRERAVKKYNMLAYKKLIFDYVPSLRDGNFQGVVVSKNSKEGIVKYELKLPTDRMFSKVHGDIVLHYTLYENQKLIMLDTITPEEILSEGHQKELTTYKKDGSDTEYVSDGYFHESEYGSAPAFDVAIDGITSITE